MTLLSMLRHSFENNFKSKPAALTHMVVPLGLHQGAMISLPSLEFTMAQIDGSIITSLDGNKVVIAVGKYSLFGKTVYKSYLDDGSSYIQLVTEKDVVLEASVWTCHDEVFPTSKEDWEFWLGVWKNDVVTGDQIYECGLIGWPDFEIDTPPASANIYNRSWGTKDEPTKFMESVIDMSGKVTIVDHEEMEYNRVLSNSPPMVESLRVGVLQTNDTASINIFVGITIDYKTLNILSI